MPLHPFAAAIGLVCAASAATAQIATPPPPADRVIDDSTAPDAVARGITTLYRLGDDAAFEEGCFPPCLCPVFYSEDLRGTLRLTPAANWTQAVQTWLVSEVNWAYTWASGASRRVVGSGTLTRTSLPGAPPTQRLILDLKVEDEPVERYDSGPQPWTPTIPSDPPVFDLKVSRAGMVCYDRVFRVAAAPVPPAAITRYSAAGTDYVEGCFPPCLCPIMFTIDARGGFDLVDLGADRGFQSFAVVNARFLHEPSPTPPMPLHATAYGIYRVGSPGMLPVLQEEMVLDTVINAQPHRLRAPFEPITDPWPAIEIDLTEHGRYCYDYVIELSARPR